MDQIISRAKQIHDKAIVIDTHVDIPGEEYCTAECDPGINNPDLKCDLVKMNEGGVDGVFLAVFISQRQDYDKATYAKLHETAKNRFAAIHRIFDLYPDRCKFAGTSYDAVRISKTSKRAIMIGIENGYCVGDDLSRLQVYYDLGARYITLSHWRNNQICDSSTDDSPKHGGLSDFGKEVVKEMNLLGMMCDASHIAESSFWDLIEISEAPIIASHSGCYAITPHARNLTDKQLTALAENGGVIQIVALGSFIESMNHKKAVEDIIAEVGLVDWENIYSMSDEEKELKKSLFDEFERRQKEVEATYPDATILDYVDHIDHAVKVAGIDHVGIGTDFDGGAGIPGFNNHSEALNVTIELVKRGYTEEEIIKILGGNLLRVWNEVEKVSAKLQSD
ncbi:dipeptidase [Bacteroidota bacterium]